MVPSLAEMVAKRMISLLAADVTTKTLVDAISETRKETVKSFNIASKTLAKINNAVGPPAGN